MSESFYFYDLETSGINSRTARIMQFAGQRTNKDLVPIGEPDNILIKLTEDVLPEPGAILVTGITPQQTIADGISEREFCKYFTESIAIPNTTILGFNSIRFDNEFIRNILYRNFYDAYEWSYKEGNSVWDILDVVRMMRALRPDGITWPFASDGRPSNSLELLTSVNSIEHSNAHDALADVRATIAVAGLIRTHNARFFNYLYNMRSKDAVKRLVTSGDPFVYTTGRYASEFHKTSVATALTPHPSYPDGRVLVYDLRYNPTEFMSLSSEELANRMQYTKDPDAPLRLPVKELVYNKCPAVAPLSVLNDTAQENISLTLDTVKEHYELLASDPTFAQRVRQVFEDKVAAYQTEMIVDIQTVDAQLYSGFIGKQDKQRSAQVRQATAQAIVDLHPLFDDERLRKLLLLYKARQFSNALSEDEQREWELYKITKLIGTKDHSAVQDYFDSLQTLAKTASDRDKALLEDLWLWAESIVPEDDY